MSITFKCECGQSFTVDDRYAGGAARCKACHRQVRIPGGPPAPPMPVKPATPGSLAQRPVPKSAMFVALAVMIAVVMAIVTTLLLMPAGKSSSRKAVPALRGSQTGGSSFTQAVKVIDRDGEEIIIRNVIIDYTDYPFVGFYTPRKIGNGVSIEDGNETTTLPWSSFTAMHMGEIRQIEHTGPPPDNNKWTTPLIPAEVALVAGGTDSVVLENASRRGLEGDTDLGRYWISLLQVRSLIPTVTPPVPPGAQQASNGVNWTIEVVDADGAHTTVAKTQIDYTDYPTSIGFYRPDHERSGIRLQHGRGSHLIPWSRIKLVTIKGRDDSKKPQRVNATLDLLDGSQREVSLQWATKEGVHGTSDKGAYSIPLDKLTTLKPVKPGPHD